MELIRDQGFREQRGEYGSRLGGDNLDVSNIEVSKIVFYSTIYLHWARGDKWFLLTAVAR